METGHKLDREHRLEEALSIIWEEREGRKEDKVRIKGALADALQEGILAELETRNLVTQKENAISLTSEGEAAARDVIRRKRLAERLLVDVLALGAAEVEPDVCEFEHILSKGVEESICTLLGHPKECPHGQPIPEGECCRRAASQAESVVTTLDQLKPGSEAKIAYILTREHSQLHRLMSLGLVPGLPIKVHQTFPATVITVEETQIALERDVARSIYVRFNSQSGSEGQPGPAQGRQRGWSSQWRIRSRRGEKK